MKLKRLITLVVAIVFCVTSFPAAFAAENTADAVAATTDLSKDYALVYDLGAANFSDAATRGEFSLAVAKLLCYGHEINSNASVYPFPDVIPDMTEYDAVSFLQSLNIVRGKGDGLYRPDDAITMQEALTIVMRTLGFENYANERSFITVATQKGFLKNLNYNPDAALTHDEAIILVNNMLMAPLRLSELNFGVEYEYFYNYIGLTKIKGTVTDDGKITYTGESNLKDGKISVDRVEYVNETKYTDLFARYVEAFYKEDGKDKVIVSMQPDEGDYIVIDAPDLKSYSNYTYKAYNESGSLKNYKLSKDFVLIYNGRTVKFNSSLNASAFNALMTPETGSVTLIKSDSSSYNVVKVLSYKNIVVGNTVYTDNSFKLFDKYAITKGSVSKNDTLALSTTHPEDNVSAHDVYGNTIAPGMIKLNDIVSYGVSYDGQHVEVIVSNNKVTAQISYVGDDSLSVEDQDYYYSHEYQNMIDNKLVFAPEAGKNYTVYINYAGEVAYAEPAGTDNVLAIYDNYTVSTGLGDNLKIRMYTEQGNLMIFTVDKKLTIDGRKFTGANEIINKLNALSIAFNATDGVYTCVSISYTQKDGKNVLLSIDTPYDLNGYDASYEDANTLHYIKGIKNKAGSKYMYMNNSFSGFFSVGSSTVVFCISPDAKSIEDVRLATINSSVFQYSVKNFNVSALAFNENAMCADALVMSSFAENLDFRMYEYGGNAKIGLVTKIAHSTNDDGEKNYTLWIDNGNSITKYTTADDTVLNFSSWAGKGDKVEVGDIVRFLVKDNTVICNGAIFSMYDFSEDAVLASSNYTSAANYYANAKHSLLAGYINRMYNGFMEISENVIDGDVNYNDQDTFVVPFEATPIIIYDTQRGTTFVGYQSDLISEQDDPAADQRIFFMIHEMKPEFILIYR